MSDIPPIPDAMVEAAQIAIAALWLEKDPKDPKDPSDIELATVATLSAFAAAPPEYLLRVALSEEELEALREWGRIVVREGDWGDFEEALLHRLSRALRGGEKP